MKIINMNTLRSCAALVAILVGVVVVVTGSGCYTMNASIPGAVRNDVKSADTEKVGTFSVEKTQYYFIYGLIGQTPPDFFSQEMKAAVQQKGADGVRDFTVESQFSCGDLVIDFITLGCVAPRTYNMSGEIVRIKAARLPGKPAKTVALPPLKDGTQVAQGY